MKIFTASLYLAIFITLLYSVACSGSQVSREARERSEELLVQGKSLARLGNMNQAVSVFEEATLQDPGNAEAHRLHAKSLYELGRTYPALDAIQKAEKLRPDHGQQQLLKGQILLRLGRLDEAEQIIAHAASEWPDQPQVQFALGSLRLKQGRLDEARSNLVKVASASPRLDGVQELLGRVLLRLGQAEKAASRFEKAVEQNECDALAFGGLGVAQIVLFRHSEAGDQFNRAARCAGEKRAAPWRAAYFVAFAAQGAFQDALDLFDEVEGFFPDRAGPAIRSRLELLLESWEQAGCSDQYDVCLEAHRRLWSGILLLFVVGAADGAEIELRRSLETYEGDAMTHWVLAEALAERGRNDEALRQLDLAFAWNPPQPLAQAMNALRAELSPENEQ